MSPPELNPRSVSSRCILLKSSITQLVTVTVYFPIVFFVHPKFQYCFTLANHLSKNQSTTTKYFLKIFKSDTPSIKTFPSCFSFNGLLLSFRASPINLIRNIFSIYHWPHMLVPPSFFIATSQFLRSLLYYYSIQISLVCTGVKNK